MKKHILLLALLIAVMLSISVSAKFVPFEEDYISDGDIVVASYHNVKPFVADRKNAPELDESVMWLAEYAKQYNLKYVSFIGNMSSGANYKYATIKAPEGVDKSNYLYEMTMKDEEWQKDFLLLKDTAEQLPESGVPYGVSIGLNDYCSDGFHRENLVQNTFSRSDFVGSSDVEQIVYDNNNHAVVLIAGKQRYIIYQLEAFPRQKVVDWFAKTQEKYPDARAIIYTTSFLQANGAMYTQHDWAVGSAWQSIYKNYNSILKTNMINADKPRDGDQLWKYAFAQWDNIVCIVSANAKTGKRIVTNTFSNNNGYDTVAVVADLESSYADDGIACPILIKLSADGKTVDIRFASPYIGYEEDTRTVIELENTATLPEADAVLFLPKVSPKANGSNTAYINGYGGGIFKPDGNMTKAEACTIFARILLEAQSIPDGYTTRFADVKKDDWFYNAIAYLDETGFLASTEGDSYKPDQPITRGEFVELAYLVSSMSASEQMTFSDVNTSNKYYNAIMAAAASGLVNGYGDGTFKPNNTITRAEVVTVINRLLNYYAGKEAVSRDHLATTFTDISGHWAEYQILVASNSNVNSVQYYNSSLSALTEDSNDISFKNKYLEVKIAKKSGKVSDIINLMTGESIIAKSTSTAFATLTTMSGVTVSPSSAKIENGRLKFVFKDFCDVYLLVESFEDYITFTLDSGLPLSVRSLSFGTLAASYDWKLDSESAFGLSGIAMTTTVDPSYYPGGASKATKGVVYNTLGVPAFGAKLGIAFSRMTEHRDHLKSITDAIDPAKGIKSTHGGAYALDNKDIFGDYVILSGGLTPETATETAKLAKKYSVDQIDVHRGVNTFYTADFNFICARTEEEKANKTFIPASVFKERIADKVTAEGVQLGLHTYSSLIPIQATNILSDPKWQQQLCFAPETYTLRGDLNRFRTSIKTVEDASGMIVNSQNIPWNKDNHTKYILIDEEIILVQQGTTSGFLNVKRAQCGTTAVNHKDGAVIRQLLGWYTMFQPKPLSELFYKIAEDTAKAYNEGGFEMIYLDGFESFTYDDFCSKDLHYYGYAEFIRTVVANCDRPPLIEYSIFKPCMWNARARGGAVDCAFRGYKKHKASHLNSQEKYHNYFYTATVGWFNYAPDKDTQYKDVLVATMYRDDLDYMGSLALANDFGTVCQPFSVAEFKEESMLANNFNYYGIYSRLRESGYFAPEVKERLLTREHEYKAVLLEDGRWAFREMEYFKHRVFMLSDQKLITGNATNPFGEQTPFIRIEQGYSSLGENEQVVIAFDETQPVTKLVRRYDVPKTNYTANYAFKIKVKGNGSSTDKVSVSVIGSDGTNRMDIPVCFTGWKDIILMESDNSGREYCSLTGVSVIEISVTGSCEGVMIDDLKSVKIVEAPVNDPSVTINGSTITFETEINSGEYIEYYPELGKAYLTYYEYEYNENGGYKNDNVFVKEIPFKGSVTVPTGAFSYTYDAISKTDAPTRADVVIGVSGDIITNPEGWNAPKVDIPEELWQFKQ